METHILPPDIIRKTRGAAVSPPEYSILRDLFDQKKIFFSEYGNRLTLLLETDFPPSDSAKRHLREQFARGRVLSAQYVEHIALLHATQRPNPTQATIMLRKRLASLEITTVDYLTLLNLTSLPYALDKHLSYAEQILLASLAQGYMSLDEYVSALPKLATQGRKSN